MPSRRPRLRLPAAIAAAAALAAAPVALGASAGDAAPPGAGPAVAAEAAVTTPVVMARLAPFSEEAAAAVAARTGLRLDGTIPEIGWATYLIDGDVAAAHAALLADPAVWRIDFMHPGEDVSVHLTPSDTIFTQQGTVAAGQLTASWNWHWTITNFPAAWDIARGNASTRVLVIDSEFDTEHIELKSKLLTGKNFDSGTSAYGTTSVRANDLDLGTLHGSHVAGLVAAVSDNANGVTGACFDCVVIPYKISLRGGPVGAPQASESKFVRDFAEALTDASARGDVRIISMSLGTDRLHQPMQDAVNLALSRGKILVASSGNGQLNNPGVPNYPASFDGVIGVGATQPDDNIAPFSTNGDFVDVSAPGHGILSTWDIRIPPNPAPPITGPTHGVGFTNLSGTSMATPIVAGLVGLMLQLKPDLSAGEVQALLERSAVDLGAPGKDNVFGAGRIDALKTLRNTQAFVRPGPPPDTRATARFFWSCKVGAKRVPAGKRAFTGVVRNQRLVCTGRTQPAIRNARLEIQRFAARRGYLRIGTVKTNNRGRFGFTRRVTTLGNWRIRVAYGGDAGLKPSGSLAVKVVARPRR